jgi:hypothetical protein
MKRFWLVGVLGALLCTLQISAFADAKKAPEVTRDNFVSLRYESVGGIAALRTETSVLGSTLWLEAFPHLGGIGLMSGAPINVPPPSSPLSNNQVKALITQINKLKLPALAGDYRQPNLADGLNETLTLTISDDENRDRSFVIQNYGKTAPQGFYKMTEYLRQLRLDKFHGVSEGPAAEALVTRQNLDSITLETSGGYAGLRSSIRIIRNPGFSSTIPAAVYPLTLFWSQQIGGKNSSGRVELTAAEFDELIRLANAANLSQLNGKKFRQPNLYDGLNEVLTVKLNGGRQFVVENYGDTAPAEYLTLVRYLNELKNRKLSSSQNRQ